MQNSRTVIGRHAVVIGASIAGLLAARTLTDHFEQVTLLEKDRFPAPGSNRKGVPQGKHIHVLLERGRQIMEMYLPGLTNELSHLGASNIQDASQQIAWFRNGNYHQPGHSGIAGTGVSRPTLEAVVRARVSALHKVRIIEGCSVMALTSTADNIRVTGVRMVHQQDRKEEIIKASLVVDASGRGSRSPKWLEEMGYHRPRIEEIKIGLGYTSCFFRRQTNHLPGSDGIVLMATPPDKRMGVIMAQDGNRWVVTLGGYLGAHVPADYHEFIRCATELPAPDLYQVIRDAELLSGPVTYKFSSNLRHHYEKLTRFPAGFLVIGDALCSFNPIYGQGMTVAAMETVAFGDSLTEGGKNLARRFFAKAARVIDPSWDSAVGNDLSFPEVDGPRTPATRFFNWYISKLHIAAQQDAQVSIAFLKVINMLAPPQHILHPKIVWKVLKRMRIP